MFVLILIIALTYILVMSVPTLPNLPTDSLYKTGFIGCVFLVALGIYLIQLKNEKYLLSEKELDDILIENNHLGSNLKNKILSIDSLYFNEDYSAEIEKNLESELKNIEISNENLILFESKIKRQIEFFDSTTSHYYMSIYGLTALIILATIGGIISVHLWYNRLQKYLDVIIKNQANKTD